MQSTLFNTGDNLLPFEGEVYFYPQFFSQAASDQYFDLLQHQVQWKQEPIKIFGKQVMQPRLTAWCGVADKPYSYSGITMQPQPWTESLLQIKTAIEKEARVNFTNALLNYYRDGKDSMGWHRDNEQELGINPVIGSVSFGASRIFRLRHYKTKKIMKSIELTHGSFLLMMGATQHYWEHQVPKTNKPIGGRINLTFRILGPLSPEGYR